MNRKTILWALVIVGFVASLYVAMQRVRVESRNRAVEIVLDYSEIEELAAASGRSPVDVLREFKNAGATSVAITEKTVKDLVDEKQAVLLPGVVTLPKEYARGFTAVPPGSTLKPEVEQFS